jgi:chromosomal replication initiation ATPase DnaA
VTRQLALDLGHRPALQRDDFLVAAANQDAVAWIDRWPAWPHFALAIAGPAGAGKSHLAAVWQVRAGATQAPDPAHVAAQGRYVLDDADRIADQTAFLHRYNLVAERGGNLLLVARDPPARWPVSLPDLRSRLASVPVAQLAAPDDALLAAVMVKQFADRQLRPADDVVLYILARIERSFAAVRQIVAALDQAALSQRKPVTVALARELLRDQDP